MEIISTLGTIFSGISLYKQLKSNNDPDACNQLLKVFSDVSKNQELIKNIHNFSHELLLGSGNNLKSLLGNFQDRGTDENTKIQYWEEFYFNYNILYEKCSIKSIKIEKFPLISIDNISELDIIKGINNSETNIEQINILLPKALTELSNLNDNLVSTNQSVIGGNRPQIKNIKTFIKNVDFLIFRTDRILMHLIELFNNICIYLLIEND